MKGRYRHLDELYAGHRERRSDIRRRLKEFRSVPPDRYLYELIYCLMTPQTSAVNAASAQHVFEENEFQRNNFDPEPILRRKEAYIRFHKTKTRWISEAKENIDDIVACLRSPKTAEEKRDWLVASVKGLSLKEATHFLRNIGMNDGLAILDRHILNCLKRYGVIRSIPATLTHRRYFSIERKFLRFAGDIGIPVDDLDLLFWSTMTGKILK